MFFCSMQSMFCLLPDFQIQNGFQNILYVKQHIFHICLQLDLLLLSNHSGKFFLCWEPALSYSLHQSIGKKTALLFRYQILIPIPSRKRFIMHCKCVILT